jgi:hypothetical protein
MSFSVLSYGEQPLPSELQPSLGEQAFSVRSLSTEITPDATFMLSILVQIEISQKQLIKEPSLLCQTQKFLGGPHWPMYSITF